MNLNMKNVIFEPIPANYGSRLVWQVNHGPTWDRKANWFWNKKEAGEFAATIDNLESNPTFVCWYPRNNYVRTNGKEIIGHAQADGSFLALERERQKKLMR